MTKLRSKRLQPVLDVVERNTQRTLDALGLAHQNLQTEQRQLADLMGYRQEYLDQFRQTDPLQVGAKKALDLRAFLTQLDQAIALQHQQVSSALAVVERCRNTWLQAQQKSQSVQNLQSRYHDEEQQAADRRLQQMTDELATGLWRRRQTHRS